MATTPSTTEVRSGTVRVNGVRLYYEEHGEGQRSFVFTAQEAPPSCGALPSPSSPGWVG
jgi:hypothetical protein